MKVKKKVIPKFKNEDDERNFWDKESPLNYFGKEKARKIVLSSLKPSTEVISLRLPSGLLSEIKLFANKNDIPYQSFMKMMLAEKINENIKEYSYKNVTAG